MANGSNPLTGYSHKRGFQYLMGQSLHLPHTTLQQFATGGRLLHQGRRTRRSTTFAPAASAAQPSSRPEDMQIALSISYSAENFIDDPLCIILTEGR
jgi:hypothetical protein